MRPNTLLRQATEAAHHISDAEPPWQDILESAARLVGADSGTLTLLDGHDFLGLTSVGIRDDTAHEYATYFHRLDFVAHRARETGVGRWLDTNTMMSIRELGRTEYYTDFLRKHGMAQALSLPLVESPALRAGLGFQRRSILQDATTTLESGDIAAYFQFLQKAVAMRQQSFGVQIHSLKDIFARLGEDICLVSALGSVLWESPSVQHFLQSEKGLVIRNGHLWHFDLFVLKRVLLAISWSATKQRRTRVAMPGSWGEMTNIDISPATPSLRLSNERVTLLRFQSSSAFSEADVDSLAAVFKLTQAEARVLAALADGHSPGDYAALACVSEHTIRNQIRVLMRKMQCTRQAELVKLALLVKS